jgi:hypothetical protein
MSGQEREALELEVTTGLEERFAHFDVPSYVWEAAVHRSIAAYRAALAAREEPLPETWVCPHGITFTGSPDLIMGAGLAHEMSCERAAREDTGSRYPTPISQRMKDTVRAEQEAIDREEAMGTPGA